jgi:hypothetical protein
MHPFFKQLYSSSQLLLDSDLNKLCADGKVFEQDHRGIKVIQLASGDFLKIFRVRNRFGGTRVYSHARRFFRNAARLTDLSIPTVEVKTLYTLQKKGHDAVLYQPLAGVSIRDLVQDDSKRMLQTAQTFGAFLARLHAKGIHFHSLHTGNILLLPNDNFGLIDISDMTIYPWRLTCYSRLRSFKRLCKYQEDMRVLGGDYWQEMLSAYLNASRVSETCRQHLLSFKPF